MLINCVPWDRMHELFSVIMILDRDLTVVSASDVLQRNLPQIGGRPSLAECFEVRRPTAARNFEDLKSKTGSLCLMVARSGAFAVRGQILDLSTPESEYLCFLGSPWLSYMTGSADSLHFVLDDFAPQDSQIDQLFHIATKERMIQDLERLNADLERTKKALEATHEAETAQLAELARELRAPAHAVKMALHLLGEQDLTGRAQTLLDLASESSASLMAVIDHTLDVPRFQEPNLAPEEKPFDLRETIASVVSVMSAAAIEKGLVLRHHLDHRLSSSYLGDHALIRQSLMNLVINVIKTSDEGEVSIIAKPALLGGMTFRVEVGNTGDGITPEGRVDLFAPLREGGAESPRAREPRVGPGLVLAMRNIRRMGGNLGFSSKPGDGPVFWFELPCGAVASDEETASDEATGGDARGRLRGRVLLVDDNETNMLLGQLMLESMGLEVVCARSGQDALDCVGDEDLDLVLMDIRMPGMDGYEATRQIRAFRDAGSLPIVALTAHAGSAERQKGAACGMNGYLTKPIILEELASTLSTWLARSDDEPRSRRADSEARHANSEAGRADSEAEVDHAVLEVLAGQIGKAKLAGVIAKFLEELGSRWAALEGATSPAEMAREAHTLASTCRSFGLPSIGARLAAIEQHARSSGTAQRPPSIAATGRELQQGARALKAAMERYRAEG